jgi:hypothetical protein
MALRIHLKNLAHVVRPRPSASVLALATLERRGGCENVFCKHFSPHHNYRATRLWHLKNTSCAGGRNPIFSHTSEGTSVFVDKRGNYHMLINAFPGGCMPKLQQGGHAWSRDGINWSEPRVGAYNTTVHFTDGSSMTCQRRERPQVYQDPVSREPLVMFTGATGCPAKAGGGAPGAPYTGGADSFTLAQLFKR